MKLKLIIALMQLIDSTYYSWYYHSLHFPELNEKEIEYEIAYGIAGAYKNLESIEYLAEVNRLKDYYIKQSKTEKIKMAPFYKSALQSILGIIYGSFNL